MKENDQKCEPGRTQITDPTDQWCPQLGTWQNTVLQMLFFWCFVVSVRAMYSGTGLPTSSEAGVPRCCEVSASSVLYRRQLLQPASAAVPLDACCLVQRRRQPCQVRAKAQRFQKHYSTGCCSNNQNSKYRFREAHALRTPLYSGVRNGGPSETQFLETSVMKVDLILGAPLPP